MLSYPPLVSGEDAPVEDWIYCLRASALLEDAFGTLTLKRDLDRGGLAGSDDPRVVGRVGISSAETIARAVSAAREAQPVWARRTLKERLEIGAAVHDELCRRARDFVEILVAEGHPRTLASWEVTGVLHGTSPETLDTQAAFMERSDRRGAREICLTRKPDGVVCLAPPRNAAASTSVLGLLAMLAGNALVMKAPRSTPMGVSWVWREVISPVLDRYDVPAGALGIVCGDPGDVIDQWLASPDVDDLMFFGSSDRGLALEVECVRRGKKPVLELAGNDGLLVWSDADLDLAARAAAECFYGSSQICMVPKYVIAHPDIAESFIAEVQERARQIRPGLPEEEDVLLSPVVKPDDYFDMLQDALECGAELVCGGERMDHRGAVDSSGVFLEPTILRVRGLGHAAGLRAVREETFFPMLPVVVPDAADDEELLSDCLRFIDENPYGLRNSVWTGSQTVAERFCTLASGGILKVNDSHIGFVPGLPTHGGTGRTGGAFGECNLPMLRTSHLQAISVATEVTPRATVFGSASLPEVTR